MYQILQTIANNSEDITKVDLIFANVTQEDIFLKAELDKLAAKKPEQITIHYNLDKAPKGWKGKALLLNERPYWTCERIPLDEIHASSF
jgi:cytochrome-b5 reductase